MVLAALILILSTAFFFFYMQATCQRILRQQFEREYFLAIVNASGLSSLRCAGRWENSTRPSTTPGCA